MIFHPYETFAGRTIWETFWMGTTRYYVINKNYTRDKYNFSKDVNVVKKFIQHENQRTN